jgi:hypothetical protein
MVDEYDDPPLESRPPIVDDLTDLCSELNSRGACYYLRLYGPTEFWSDKSWVTRNSGLID